MVRRPCWAEISTCALEHNYRHLARVCREITGSAIELLAIVKADAYGHGLGICAPAAVRAGARWLGVTSVEEGVAARAATADLAAGLRILVIGGVFPGQGADVVAHGLTPVVWEPSQLEELETAAKAAGRGPGEFAVHLELDTGMSRQGAGPEELGSILPRFGRERDAALRLDGLLTHLYAADEGDGRATREQLELLEAMAGQVREAGLAPGWLHVGNSAAVMLGGGPGKPVGVVEAIAERFGMRPMARPGLALYGLAPEFDPQPSEGPSHLAELAAALQPVLAWKANVVSVREIDAGRVVGYNGTFVASEPMRLALLPVGYADGLKRGLSNRGCVLLHGQRAPIVGRISMDQTVVDVTEIPNVAAGDEAVLLGSQGSDSITAHEHADWAGTIVWEIFTSIQHRVARRMI